MRTAVLVLCIASSISGAFGQRVFHDPVRDKQGQDAVTAGKEVTSGSLFQKMLRNVEEQTKLEAEESLRWTEQEMLSAVQNFNYWHHKEDKPGEPRRIPGLCGLATDKACKSVRCELEAIEVQLEIDTPQDRMDIPTRLKEIEDRRNELKKLVAELGKNSKTKDPLVLEILSHSGEAEDMVKFANRVASSRSPTAGKVLGQIAEALGQIKDLYEAVNSIWKGMQAIKDDPFTLRPAVEVVQLRLLAAEEEHLKALAMIEARRLNEVGAVRARIDSAKARLKSYWDRQELIESTLANLARTPERDQLSLVWMGLHEAASAAAQNAAACRLAALRWSDEERRYSIRCSAIHASAYDETIQAALGRLALYYKGGIKPAQLAQFIFNLAGAISLPVIATK